MYLIELSVTFENWTIIFITLETWLSTLYPPLCFHLITVTLTCLHTRAAMSNRVVHLTVGTVCSVMATSHCPTQAFRARRNQTTLPISAGSSPAACQDPAATLAATHRLISSYVPADPRFAFMCHMELVWLRKNRTTNFNFENTVSLMHRTGAHWLKSSHRMSSWPSRPPDPHDARQNSNMLEFSRPRHGESAASSRLSRLTWPGREK